LVVDIFAGSNTTGYVAECEGRKWVAFEERVEYVAASSFRFFPETATDGQIKSAHDDIVAGQILDLRSEVFSLSKQPLQNAQTKKLVAPTQGLLLLAETADSSSARKKRQVSYRSRA
jgi:hypothetical protein